MSRITTVGDQISSLIVFVQYHDRVSPMMKHVETMAEVFQISGAPIAPQMFGNAGIEHMKKYGRWRL